MDIPKTPSDVRALLDEQFKEELDKQLKKVREKVLEKLSQGQWRPTYHVHLLLAEAVLEIVNSGDLMRRIDADLKQKQNH